MSFDPELGRNEIIIISFEGIDAAGKNTQARRLVQFFRNSGTPCEFLSFPDYTTPIGQEIRNFLDHRRSYNPETRHMLLAANKYEHKERIENWVAEGKIVVINRYTESNLAYGAANGLSLEWLAQLESGMPKADYIFYLKLSPDTSANRKRSRDLYESDLAYLKRVSSIYEAMFEPGRWFAISADQPRDLIHYEIAKTISTLDVEKSNINRGAVSQDGQAIP